MTSTPRIFSGMQPTGSGELHIGNYLGALKNWVALSQEGTYDALFCVVDAHAATAEYDPKEMPTRIFGTALSYLAAGLDPAHCTVFAQSDVPQHMELAWYLSTVTPMGDLHRMTQFKEKSDQYKQNVNAGLFTYPVLMAADILLYRATVVPVGNDQVQHLELSREICRKFNARFGDVFPEPKPKLTQTPRIMGLDGKRKMSKSLGNSIDLFDDAKTVEKKLKRAFTDEQKLQLGDPGRPEVCNVFTMHTALTAAAEVKRIDTDCRSGALGCGECKKRLTESMNAELAPIQARAAELRGSPKRVLDVLEAGAERARGIARETMADVREAMGMNVRAPKP
ncbi:MAG: tryptophan--tRNA ligase [Polyangiaceae bacterium]|nr:tryptophan--tRNA ligase [Polyangiaceae bacterium]MCE7891726.1 tryptophan--tRNA ligase [Sorangiineae bacterium PRO1]MCL4754902.1 tryptophan--tRNA ligase [Myxococcales bacterium]